MTQIIQTPRGFIVISTAANFPRLQDLQPFIADWKRVPLVGRVS